MNRILGTSLTVVLLLGGCSVAGDPNAIDLKTALANTEKGEYKLVVVSEGDKLVSFQAGERHKRQYYFEGSERDEVLRKVSTSVRIARKNGFSLPTVGLQDFLADDDLSNTPHPK